MLRDPARTRLGRPAWSLAAPSWVPGIITTPGPPARRSTGVPQGTDPARGTRCRLGRPREVGESSPRVQTWDRGTVLGCAPHDFRGIQGSSARCFAHRPGSSSEGGAMARGHPRRKPRISMLRLAGVDEVLPLLAWSHPGAGASATSLCFGMSAGIAARPAPWSRDDVRGSARTLCGSTCRSGLRPLRRALRRGRGRGTRWTHVRRMSRSNSVRPRLEGCGIPRSRPRWRFAAAEWRPRASPRRPRETPRQYSTFGWQCGSVDRACPRHMIGTESDRAGIKSRRQSRTTRAESRPHWGDGAAGYTRVAHCSEGTRNERNAEPVLRRPGM